MKVSQPQAVASEAVMPERFRALVAKARKRIHKNSKERMTTPLAETSEPCTRYRAEPREVRE